jgi:hypothetical protein
MTTTMKYNLKQITDISFSGINFAIPEDTYNMINYLCMQVGSSAIVSNVFNKTENDRPETLTENVNGFSSGGIKSNNKKKRGNKGAEISSDEWESIRSFQATKLEQRTGLDADIDQIRLFLNKLTDKTFLDIREKMIERINKITSEDITDEDRLKIANTIYDMCSMNKFYSRIFAELFAELANKYQCWMMPMFDEKYANIMLQYNYIQYVDSEKDYDGFCEMNKKNEKRRAITTFFMNLAIEGFIPKDGVMKILKNLLEMVQNMIRIADRKNEVDELTENIAILFNKDIIDEVEDDSDEPEEFYINGQTIIESVNSLAKSKAKDYPSLSNKAIFKFMDLVEM